MQRVVRSLRRLYKFSTTQPHKAAQTGVLKEEEKQYQTPVYLRPYDAAKYEVLSDKIKINSGYALVQIEPFPRARIMRLSYNILQRLRQIPEKAVYRMLTEQRIKHIMKLTDEIEDIIELQNALGTESVQFFLNQLAEQFQGVQIMKQIKPWIKTDEDESAYIPPYHEPIKDPRYIRPPRQQTQFVESSQSPK